MATSDPELNELLKSDTDGEVGGVTAPAGGRTESLDELLREDDDGAGRSAPANGDEDGGSRPGSRASSVPSMGAPESPLIREDYANDPSEVAGASRRLYDPTPNPDARQRVLAVRAGRGQARPTTAGGQQMFMFNDVGRGAASSRPRTSLTRAAAARAGARTAASGPTGPMAAGRGKGRGRRVRPATVSARRPGTSGLMRPKPPGAAPGRPRPQSTVRHPEAHLSPRKNKLWRIASIYLYLEEFL